MKLAVESTINTQGDAEPVAFRLGEQRVEVLRVIDRWLAPGYGYFKVHASDGATYILRHDEPVNEWELTLYKAPGAEQ